MPNPVEELFDLVGNARDTLTRTQERMERLRNLTLAQWVAHMSIAYKLPPEEVIKKLKETLAYLESEKSDKSI